MKNQMSLLALTMLLLTFSQASAQTTLGPLMPTTDMGIRDGNVLTVNVNANLVSSNHVTYIKYDLTGVSGTILSATIDGRPASYKGPGEVKISSGSHSNWSPSNSSTLPTPQTELATHSFDGEWAPYTINLSVVDPSVYTSGTLTLIIENVSGNTVGFARIGNTSGIDAKVPKLTVQYTPGSSNDNPTAPTNVVATDNGNGTASITWTASTDNDGIANYKIFADENANNGGYTEIGTSTTTSFTTGVLNTTDYQFEVSAVDNSNDNLESSTRGTSNAITITNGGGLPENGVWSSQIGTNHIYYDTGNVGIGTTNIGTWQLAVGGRIRAEEVKVETGWADYVFQEGYKLPTLKQVERHIAEKGHLINIPSAEEVEANGIELGEMNKLLLEKIEELTLYILQQDERLAELEQQLKIDQN